jgi:excinuclease UvrABC helicase subunit UvrB
MISFFSLKVNGSPGLSRSNKQKTAEMNLAAKNLQFETAAIIRDEITQLKKLII